MDTTIIPTDLITPIEVAALLKTSPGTVRRWVLAGKLPAYKVGGRVRVSRADALAMVQRVELVKRAPRGMTQAELREREREAREILRRVGAIR